MNEKYPVKRRRLRDEAIERQKESDKRSPAERVAILDAKLGKNVGAKRERAKLATAK